MIYSNEIDKLKPFLTAIALDYLRTGKYDTVATFGGEALTPNQRRLLDQLRDDPTSVSAGSLVAVSRKNVAQQSLQGAVSGIIRGRETAAEELAAKTEIAATPSPDRPPTGPLPAGQEYVYDYRRNVWMVVEGGTRFITDVNLEGRAVPASAPGGGEPPKSGSTVSSDGRGRLTVSAEDAVDQAELAQAEFDVGGAAAGRGFAGSVQGGFGRTADDAAAAQNAADVDAATAASDIATAGGVVGDQTTTADTEIPVDWETAAAEMYPEYYAIVKSVPEVAALLKKSLGPPAWSDEKLEAELRKTNWWKTTVASAREWDMASGLDPATYQGYIDAQATAIQQEALDLGIRLSDERLQKLATDALRFNWVETSPQTITNAIGMAALEGGTAGATQLREGYYGQLVRATANQYGVTLADQTFNQFVDKIAVGEETINSFQDYASAIAKSLYPSLAEQFDAGRTFNQATDNYKQIAANILERDPNSINMTDPTWVQAVTYQPDPKTGEQRMMNMAEWGDYLRKNEALGYQYTTEARSRAYEVADKLANMFGRV